MIPANPHIAGAFFKAFGYLSQESKKIMVSVSGGSDSDIVVDFMHQCGVFGKSYEYTRKYLAYRSEKENETKRQIRSTPVLETYYQAVE